MRRSLFHYPRYLLALAGLLLPTAAPAQSVADSGQPPDWMSAFDVTAPPQDPNAPRPKPRRIQLFRISDPVGLDSDDTPDAAPADDGPDWFQVSMGSDNPFFDFRRPGDPGGVGYYKLHSQVQVLDTGTTAFAVGFQAVAPAGLDQDGIQNGQTVVSPSLWLYHELDDGTGIHGFVSKNVNVNASSLNEPMQRNVQYGLAVQRPLLDTGPDKLGSFYVFVEALGRSHYDDATAATGPATVWEMVPGVHWRMTDSLWLSGGVLVPVNTTPLPREAHLWQLTCSFQF
jgi:hypothetical protein